MVFKRQCIIFISSRFVSNNVLKSLYFHVLFAYDIFAIKFDHVLSSKSNDEIPSILKE